MGNKFDESKKSQNKVAHPGQSAGQPGGKTHTPGMGGKEGGQYGGSMDQNRDRNTGMGMGKDHSKTTGGTPGQSQGTWDKNKTQQNPQQQRNK